MTLKFFLPGPLLKGYLLERALKYNVVLLICGFINKSVAPRMFYETLASPSNVLKVVFFGSMGSSNYSSSKTQWQVRGKSEYIITALTRYHIALVFT